jgi:hypothetical protein
MVWKLLVPPSCRKPPSGMSGPEASSHTDKPVSVQAHSSDVDPLDLFPWQTLICHTESVSLYPKAHLQGLVQRWPAPSQSLGGFQVAVPTKTFQPSAIA